MRTGGIPNPKRALSKFRQLLANRFLGGIVLTLMTTHAAIADSTGKQLPYRDCFEATAKTYNLDSDWLTAIAIVESSLNPKAVSSANAVGLMQIKWPQTAAHLGARSRAALFDPCTNVDLGGRYLRELTDRYEGDMQRALAAYRIGPTALARTSSEPEVVLEYRRRINEQLDILRPNRASNYISQVSLPSKPAPKPAKIEPERLKKKAPPSQIVMAASTPATATNPSPPPKPAVATVAESPAETPRCDLRTLQLQSLSTHHPSQREQRFFTWLSAHGSACSLQHLVQVKNQMAVWLGTAAGSQRINLSLEKLLQAGRTTKVAG